MLNVILAVRALHVRIHASLLCLLVTSCFTSKVVFIVSYFGFTSYFLVFCFPFPSLFPHVSCFVNNSLCVCVYIYIISLLAFLYQIVCLPPSPPVLIWIFHHLLIPIGPILFHIKTR